MSPAQRLAEWEAAQTSYYVTSCRDRSGNTERHSITISAGDRNVTGIGATCDAAITAALDASEKGG